jgi:hypothetical protein
MATCDVCGREENMPYRCRHCGGTFCSEHRLPESHGCPGLEDWGDPGGVFDSGFDDSVNQEATAGSRGVFDRLTETGGPLSYFRGNMTYVFLGIMVVVFLLEHVVLLTLGGEAFTALFVLSPQNPLYVWTWFTSVFSHAPFTWFHIFGNGIALFFFGPIVEDYVGTKAYVALFLASGVLAGLGQIGLSLLLGDPINGVLGASGAVMAILAVLTVLNPDMRVLLYFIIPVPIWVITFGYAGLSLVGTFSTVDVGGNIAHIAHLTGLVIGLAYGEYVRRQGVRGPGQLQLGGSGGPGGPGRGRGPF